MPKIPQRHKNKKQVEAEFKKRQENARQRHIVIEQLYPVILKHAKSIENASHIIASFNMAVGTAFSNRKNDWTLEQIVAFEKFNDALVDAPAYQDLLAILKNEKVFDAEAMMRELGNALDAFDRKEKIERPFSSLKTDFVPIIDPTQNENTKKN